MVALCQNAGLPLDVGLLFRTDFPWLDKCADECGAAQLLDTGGALLD